MNLSSAALIDMALPFALRAATRIVQRNPLFIAAAVGGAVVYRVWKYVQARRLEATTVTADAAAAAAAAT